MQAFEGNVQWISCCCFLFACDGWLQSGHFLSAWRERKDIPCNHPCVFQMITIEFSGHSLCSLQHHSRYANAMGRSFLSKCPVFSNGRSEGNWHLFGARMESAAGDTVFTLIPCHDAIHKMTHVKKNNCFSVCVR